MEKREKIKVKYFVDPICSTCWIYSPYVNKLVIEYGHVLDFEYCFGTLLKTWEAFNEEKPNVGIEDIIALWKKESSENGMPLNDKIWKDSPILSSYPISLACTAVKQINSDLTSSFFRLLQEVLFLNNHDTSKLSLQQYIVNYFGISEQDFIKALGSKKAIGELKSNMKFIKEKKIDTYPTMYFIKPDGTEINCDSLNTYSDWEEIIRSSNPGVKKHKFKGTIEDLINDHPFLSTHEIAVILETSIQSLNDKLSKFEKKKVLRKENFGQTDFWKPFSKKSLKIDEVKSRKSVAIIGGGVAGLSVAINLKAKGIDSVIFEKRSKLSDTGLGFVIMKNGIDALRSMGLYDEIARKSTVINNFKSFNYQGDLLKETEIEPALFVTRKNLMDTLKRKLGYQSIMYSKQLKRYHKGFDGEYGLVEFADETFHKCDMVIASDGVSSPTRKNLFPDTNLLDVDECEIVGVTDNRLLNAKLGKNFWKIIAPEKGINVGMIPSGINKVIWFIQINTMIHKEINFKSDLKDIAMNFMKDLKFEFANAVSSSKSNDIYLWKMKDCDLLPNFCDKNLILIGDAAHPLLSFTSQGVSMALEDGLVLSNLLSNQPNLSNIKDVGTTYYNLRKEQVQTCITEGRGMLQDFLFPEKNTTIGVPLVQILRK